MATVWVINDRSPLKWSQEVCDELALSNQGNRSQHLDLCWVFPPVATCGVEHSHIIRSMPEARRTFTQTRISGRLYPDWLKHTQCTVDLLLFYWIGKKGEMEGDLSSHFLMNCFLSLLWADSSAIPSLSENCILCTGSSEMPLSLTHKCQQFPEIILVIFQLKRMCITYVFLFI